MNPMRLNDMAFRLPMKWLLAIPVFIAVSMFGTLVAQTDTADVKVFEEYQVDSQSVRKTAREILDAPEFRHFQRLKKRKDEALADSEDSSNTDSPDNEKTDDKTASKDGESSGGEFFQFRWLTEGLGTVVGLAFHGMAWFCLAVVCGLLAILIFNAVRNYESTASENAFAFGDRIEGEAELEQAPGELPADVYVQQASNLARRGEYREAVSQLLLGAMSAIERTGAIRFRRGLTFRDYLRAVRRDNETYRSLSLMVRIYEPLGFGRREATREHFDQTLTRYQTGFIRASETSEN